ncbi:hypothetical protein GCM10009530_10460 [Microbispora corallina]|uniref:DUF11 domain-containing protein n=1 Tax=Microbispora corallina TaxID=83302 RepID=A0ABQ4FW10_9ACTN|nr:hypothetical protein [Microbispora corallina]GIH39009.1 hypothetical protein Mco01_20090 [Microbispora corallina]
MRTLIVKLTTLLAVPLTAAALTAGPAAAASASTTSSTAAKAASAPVRILVNYPYRVRAGRVVSFKVRLVNNTKSKTHEIFLATKFPKGVSKVRIYVPKGSNYHERCSREQTRALCVFPGLSRAHTYTVWAKAWVSGSARGKLYGYIGGVVTDTSLDTDPRELLSEFGDDINWIKTKSTIYR